MALLALSACADEIPGSEPPADQLYFPTALTVVQDDLLVISSNFDQRYNAGRVHQIDIPELLSAVPADAPGIVFADEGDAETALPVKSTLRIDQFGSALVHKGDSNQLFIPSRGRNLISSFPYTPGQPLTCSTPAEPPSRFDCDDGAYATGFQDPHSFVLLPQAFAIDGSQELTSFGLVSHLRSVRDDDQIFRQAVARVDLNGLATARPYDLDDLETRPRIPGLVRSYPFDDFGGVSGLVLVPGGRLDVPLLDSTRLGTAVAVEKDSTTTGTLRVRLRGFEVRKFKESVLDDSGMEVEKRDAPALVETQNLDLTSVTTAVGSRGLVFDETRDRLYVSLRFEERGDSSNAALATVDVRGESFEVINLAEAGEELGTPVIHQVPNGPRLAYVPDIRTNTIWIFDVSTDAVQVVHSIEGLGERDFSGVVSQVDLLDSPADIDFYDAGDRQVAFVANFANSTIAVIDVSDPNPRRHRVVARLGRNIDAEGEQESP